MQRTFWRRLISSVTYRMREPPSMRQILSKYREGDYSGAYTALCEVMAETNRWSEDGDVYVFWAELELRVSRDGHRALAILDKASRVGCSADAYYHAKRGEAFWATGEKQKALECFEESVALSATAPYLTNLAWALSSLGDPRALGIWHRIVEEDPRNCYARTYIGSEALESGDREEALRMVKEAEESQSSSRDAFEIGRLYMEMEEFDSAIRKFREAASLGYEPKGIPYAAIADCLLSQGHNAEAREFASLAFRHSPEESAVRDVKERCG